MNEKLKEQCSKFPTSSTFDYRVLVKDGVSDEDELNKKFNPRLVQLVNNLSKSAKSKKVEHSQLYMH